MAQTPSPDDSGRDALPRATLALLLAIAALTRIAWWLVVEIDPRGTLMWDMTFYDLAASRVADGFGLYDFDGNPTAKWSPGYPVLLGLAYRAFGHDLAVPALINLALGVLTVWLTFALGRRLLGPREAALGAGIMALFPGHVLYTPLLLSEPLFTALFTAALLLFALASSAPQRSAWLSAAFGAVLGAAILVRGTPTMFLPLPVALWWLQTRSLRVTVRRSVAAALGVLALTAPWAIRNYATMGYLGLATQQIGMPMTYSHSEAADGGMSMKMSRFRDELIAPFRDLPQPERELAEVQFEVDRGIRYFLEHPLRDMSLLPWRWYHFLRHDHTALDWARPRGSSGEPSGPVLSEAADHVVARLADAWFHAVVALSVWGLALCFAGGPSARWILPLAALYHLALHGFVVMGDPRFHAALYPVLSLGAAVALRDLARRRAVRRMAAAAA